MRLDARKCKGPLDEIELKFSSVQSEGTSMSAALSHTQRQWVILFYVLPFLLSLFVSLACTPLSMDSMNTHARIAHCLCLIVLVCPHCLCLHTAFVCLLLTTEEPTPLILGRPFLARAKQIHHHHRAQLICSRLLTSRPS